MNTALPEAFIVRMRAQLGPDADAFFAALEQPYQRGLRLNPRKPLRALPEGVLDSVPWNPAFGRYLSQESAAGLDPLHEAGAYYIQEPSAMAPVTVLAPKPGERVLDLCAAPGGKSTQIADALAGRGLLVSNEPVPGRAKILSRNMERMGVPNALVVCAKPERLAPLWEERFDAVLVDAPCSGEGMFRRHPETRDEWTAQSPEGCAGRQRDILHCAARMTRPGGRLVYSTCTFNQLENEGVVEAFLQDHPDWRAEAFSLEIGAGRRLCAAEGMLHLYPHVLRGEGHFVALLCRKGEACREPLEDAAKLLAAPEKSMLQAWQTFAGAFGGCLPTPNAQWGDALLSVPPLPPLTGVAVLRAGIRLGGLKGKVFAPDHALAMVLERPGDYPHMELSREQALDYQRGETLETRLSGYGLVCYQGLALGFGKGSEGRLKNHYPKGLRRP